MNTSISLLSDLNACTEARAFAKTCPDLETAWIKCERGDWLLWFASKRGVKRETLVLIACECARTALEYTKDPRVLTCIETAEKWARGEATIEQVREARKNAAAAADAYAAAAAYAYDAYAAYAYDAYAAAARSKALRRCADIVRATLPTLPA